MRGRLQPISLVQKLQAERRIFPATGYNRFRCLPYQTQLRLRRQSSTSVAPERHNISGPVNKSTRRALEGIPTTTLVRSLIVLSATALPARLLAFLIRMTKRNVGIIESIGVLRWTFKKMLYDNFCIGHQKDEIYTKTQELRRIGFTGIVLANAREAQMTDETNIGSVIDDAQCEEWVTNNLESVEQAEAGDYVGLRFTGAGAAAAKFLSQFSALCKTQSLEEAQKAFSAEMEYYVNQVLRICNAAEARQVRVHIDAESSMYQKAIDCAALQIMSKCNTSHRALVLNTYQMYLRSNVDKIKAHLEDSIKHNYILGIKMVRGAYLHTEIDKQSLHISKEETDLAYDSAVKFLLSEGIKKSSELAPQTSGNVPAWTADIMLATHNAASVRKAFSLYTSQDPNSQIHGLTFAQLLGMADEVSMDLVTKINDLKSQTPTNHFISTDEKNPFPRLGVYKYTAWGSLRDCLLYVLRRAEENKDAVARTKDTAWAIWGELKSRAWRRN